MASEVADLWVKLSLLSQGFTEGLSKAGAEAEGFSGRMSKIGEGLSTFAKGAGLAFAGAGIASVKMAGDWQASMIRLVTSAGEAGGAIDGKLTGPIANVSKSLLDMAVQTGTSTKQLADGMYFVESAGYHGAQGLKVMRAAAEGAKAENAQLSTVSDALTTVLHDMGFTADQAVPVMNMMIRAVGSGKMTMEQFAGALHSVLPQAHSAGISFADVSAAIATMTVAGTSAEQTTTDLGHTIQSLQSPNAIAVKAMATFGLSTMDLKEHLGERGLLGTMSLIDRAIIDHMGPDGTYLQNVFNKSQVAAQDLNTMLANMPPSLRKLALEVEHGTMSAKDFNQATGALPANLKADAAEFLTLYKNANSFNQSLRNGVPGADTFAGSLRKVLGDTIDTSTALQIGGVNLSTFAANEKDIADGAKNAGDHIETWGTITQGFNFRIDQAKELLATTAIKVGTVLLPKLMDLMDFISRTAGPVLKDMAVKVHDALNSPAIHEAEGILVQFMKDFGRTLKDVWVAVTNLWQALQPVASLLAGAFLMALQAVGSIMANVVGPAVEAVTGFLKDHSGTIRVLAEIVLPALLGRLIILKTLDVFTGLMTGLNNVLTGFQNFNRQVATGQVFDTVRLKAMYAADSVKNLAVQEGEAAAAAEGASVGGIGGFLGKLGGAVPVLGLAVTGVSLLSMAFDNNSKSAQIATGSADEFVVAMMKVGDAAGQTAGMVGITGTADDINTLNHALNGTLDILRDKFQGKKIVDAGTLDAFNKLADSSVRAVEPVAQLGTALARVNQLHSDQAVQGLHNFDDALAKLATSGHADRAKEIFDQIASVVDKQGNKLINTERDFPDYLAALNSMSAQQALGVTTTQDSTSALETQAKQLLDSTGATNSLADSTSNLMQQQQDMSKGLNADRALDNYKKSIQDVTQALKDNGKSITGDTDAARNNRDAIRNSVQAMLDDYNANIAMGDSSQTATDKLKKQIDQLVNQSSQSDATRKAVKAYIDQLQLIPPSVDTTINANTAGAESKINNLQSKINELNNLGGSPSQAYHPKGGGKVSAYAQGGFVDAPRGAPQLAIVHGGEYVVSLDEMSDSDYGHAGGGLGMMRGSSGTVNFYINGSVLSERDLRDLVQTLMLQLGARYSSSYTPYKR